MKRTPAKVAGTTGGIWVLIALGLFACITFPPLFVLAPIALMIWLLVALLNRGERKRHANSHAARMDQFYREQEAAKRTFANPGWRL